MLDRRLMPNTLLFRHAAVDNLRFALTPHTVPARHHCGTNISHTAFRAMAATY